MKNEATFSQHETNDRPYKCEKSFTQHSTLKDHRKIHTCENSFKCDLCQKSFTSKLNLYMHVRIHKGEKGFKCDYCEKSFIRIHNLKMHQRTHRKEYDKCAICGSLVRKGYLESHELIHTGYKIFTCDSCKKVFNNEYAYVLHKKSVHKDTMQEKESSNNFASSPENITENQPIKTVDQRAEIKEEIVIETDETNGEDPLAVPEEEESFCDGDQNFVVFHEI